MLKDLFKGIFKGEAKGSDNTKNDTGLQCINCRVCAENRCVAYRAGLRKKKD